MADQQLFAVTVEAVGEVRDADGNLIETVPIKQTINMTADELAAFQGGQEA